MANRRDDLKAESVGVDEDKDDANSDEQEYEDLAALKPLPQLDCKPVKSRKRKDPAQMNTVDHYRAKCDLHKKEGMQELYAAAYEYDQLNKIAKGEAEEGAARIAAKKAKLAEVEADLKVDTGVNRLKEVAYRQEKKNLIQVQMQIKNETNKK